MLTWNVPIFFGNSSGIQQNTQINVFSYRTKIWRSVLCVFIFGLFHASCGHSWHFYHHSEWLWMMVFASLELELFTRNHWHVGAEQDAKFNAIFCSLLAGACDESKCWTTISTLLTLCAHPTVDTGSRPNDVQHIWLSCQVHLLSSALEIIHLLCELVKKKKKKVSKFCFMQNKCKLYYTID